MPPQIESLKMLSLHNRRFGLNGWTTAGASESSRPAHSCTDGSKGPHHSCTRLSIVNSKSFGDNCMATMGYSHSFHTVRGKSPSPPDNKGTMRTSISDLSVLARKCCKRSITGYVIVTCCHRNPTKGMVVQTMTC